MTAFHSNGIVDGLVHHVAQANVSESGKEPDPVRALVWHGSNVLLVGTEQGEAVNREKFADDMCGAASIGVVIRFSCLLPELLVSRQLRGCQRGTD